jgi:hypothetical protein
MTRKRWILAGLALGALGSSLPLHAQVAQAAQTATAMPVQLLKNYAHGLEMLDQAMTGLTLDIGFKFLNKTYENDVYVTEPVTGRKVRTSCVRFKSSSGFAFKASTPDAHFTQDGVLVVVQTIDKIDAEGLNFSFQLGPCVNVAGGFGVKLRDVKLTYKARPMIKFPEIGGGCQVTLNPIPDDMRVSIGDLNILGVQNDLDKLAKDAVREALNATLGNFFNQGLGSGLARAAIKVCGGAKKR